MPQITGAFDAIQNEIGTIINIPFDLQVAKASSQKPGETRKFPVVSLIPSISTANMEILRNHLQAHSDFKRLGVIFSDAEIGRLEDSGQLALSDGCSSVTPTTEKLLSAFESLGIGKYKLELLYGKSVQALDEHDIAVLREIHTAIKRGVDVEEAFK